MPTGTGRVWRERFVRENAELCKRFREATAEERPELERLILQAALGSVSSDAQPLLVTLRVP